MWHLVVNLWIKLNFFVFLPIVDSTTVESQNNQINQNTAVPDQTPKKIINSEEEAKARLAEKRREMKEKKEREAELERQRQVFKDKFWPLTKPHGPKTWELTQENILRSLEFMTVLTGDVMARGHGYF